MKSLIEKFVRVPFTTESALVDIGLDSLAVVRIAVAALPDADREIDPGELAGLRTVGQFQTWLDAQGGAR